MSASSEPVPPGRVGKPLSLFAVLTVLLVATTSAALVLAILHFKPTRQDGKNKDGGDSSANAGGELLQKGTVKVEDAACTTVFYPIPYGSPPHLTLTTTAGSRKFVINRQDELGFTWSMALTQEEASAIADALKSGGGKDKEKPNPKPDPGPPEFAWEARGVQEKAASPYPKPFEQKGSFTAPGRQEGQIYFASPYAAPPNVSLGVSTSNVQVQTVSPLGFTWKNPDSSNFLPPTINWTALGVKATAEQIALITKNESPFKVVEQKGVCSHKKGLKGTIYFSLPYASPPNVVFEDQRAIVTDVTPINFKWESLYDLSSMTETKWTARGVLATSIPVDRSGK